VNSGFPIFRFRGTEVRLHWSWVLLLAVVTFMFAEGLLGEPGIGLDAAWSWGAAAAIAALVLGSVVAHELGHVMVAQRNGLAVNVIVVQLLGGAFLMDLRPQSPGQELRVATSGSVVSLALATLFGVVAGVLTLGWGNAVQVPPGVEAAAFVAEALAVFNVFVAAVNLIPAYPLDGARIVHAMAWSRSGEDEAAVRVSSRVGRLVGYATLLAGGVAAALWDLVPGILLVIAGWLLVGSSRVLERRLLLRELMAGSRVSDAADGDVSHLPPQLTLDVVAQEYLGERFGGAALVERGEQLLGIIGAAQIRRVPQRRWSEVRIEDAMVPVAAVPRASGDSDLWPAIETLERSGLDAMLIAAGEHISALLTRRSVARLVQQRMEAQTRFAHLALGRAPLPRPGGRRGPTPPSGGGDSSDHDQGDAPEGTSASGQGAPDQGASDEDAHDH
jgi:Zn-dependent protease